MRKLIILQIYIRGTPDNRALLRENPSCELVRGTSLVSPIFHLMRKAAERYIFCGSYGGERRIETRAFASSIGAKPKPCFRPIVLGNINSTQVVLTGPAVNPAITEF